MKINIPFEISEDIINNALVGAREGGCNYWAKSRLIKKANWEQFMPSAGRILIIGGKQAGQELYINKEYKAGQSFFDIENNHKIELFVTYEVLKKGLIIMAEKYAEHFSNLIGQNDDNVTHDVFLQCVLLGDLIYG